MVHENGLEKKDWKGKRTSTTMAEATSPTDEALHFYLDNGYEVWCDMARKGTKKEQAH
jgi:hypothetical protein